MGRQSIRLVCDEGLTREKPSGRCVASVTRWFDSFQLKWFARLVQGCGKRASLTALFIAHGRDRRSLDISIGTSSDVDSGVREAEQAALRAPGTSNSASFARWTFAKTLLAVRGPLKELC